MSEDTSIDGATEDAGFNFDAVIPGTEPAPAPTQQDSPAGNPAWSEALATIPKEFHQQLTPHFEKWDRSTQERFDRVRQEAVAPYEPFQAFVDQQANPEEVVAAYQIWQQINENPMVIYERLGQLLRESGQLDDGEVEEGEEGEYEDDPRLTQMQNQLNQLLSTMSEREQQAAFREQSEYLDNQIASEVQMIEQHAGPMSDDIKTELYNRASMMTDREQRPVSLIEAYQEMQQVRQMMLSGRPGPQAPRVVPNGGGFPQASAQPQGFGTLDDRIARMGEIIRQQNS